MQNTERRMCGAAQRILAVAVVMLANVAMGADAKAQSYPAKPIRLVVGFAAGGAADVPARLLAQKLSEVFAQQVIVENRTGASGAIATERVATSPPDGYTLLMGTAAETIQPVIRANLSYDLERDLAPVSLVVVGPYVLAAHPSVPAISIKELIALARSQSGKLSLGSAGIGSTTHLAGALFGLMANAKLVHIPYKGGAESAVGTAAGQVDMNFAGISGVLPMLGAGKIRALGVSTLKRASLLPTVPTINEAGLPGYDRSGWYGILVPAQVSRDVIQRLNAAIAKVINTPDMGAALSKQGIEPQSSTPEQFAALIKSELSQNGKLVKSIGLKEE